VDNPLTYVGAGFVLLVVGFILGRVSADIDRKDRQTDDQRRASREAMVRYIHSTRDRLLNLLEFAEVVADGDLRRGLRLATEYRTSKHPDAYNELTSDVELVHELTTTLPEIMERGWGKSRGSEWTERLSHVGTVIRRGMRDQEQRILAGDQPTLATREQAAAMDAARARVNAVLDRKLGRSSK
jgi:hypothetical protein